MSIPFYFWFPILVTSGIGFSTMIIPPVADQFMDLFGVGFGGLSFFLSAYYWTHSLIQVPAGILIDRIGPVRSLLLATGTAVLCSLVPFFAPESLVLAISMRLVLGLCSGCLFLVCVKIIKLTAPPRYVSRVQGAQGAAFSLGTMVPYLALPCFGAYGWIAAYALSAFYFVTFFYGAYRLPLRAMRRTKTVQTFRQTWQSVKSIATSREVWFLGCAHGLAFGSLTSVVGNWLPSILVDTRPGTAIEDWALITSVLLLIGTAARVLSGDLARKVPRGRIISVAMLSIGICHWSFAISPGPWIIIAVAFVMAPLCGGTFASLFTLTTDTAPPTAVATAVGFMNMVANLVNVIMVMALGAVRDFTGSFSTGLMVSGSLALAFWFFSRKMAATIEPE